MRAIPAARSSSISKAGSGSGKIQLRLVPASIVDVGTKQRRLPQFKIKFQVVTPSLESVLIATSRPQLATYVQSESSCQASVSKLVARWRMNLT
jgi:hypothetical protein